jgi:hypothetical protein
MSTYNHYKQRYDHMIHHYQAHLCEGYVEKHHITPRCLGGSDDIDNLVLLPLRAHYLAHYMLTKMYPDNNKLYHAFAAMARQSKNHQRHFTSKQYEKMKKARSSAMTGVPRPEHVKQKLRKPKSTRENYSKPKSDLHRSNISQALTGTKKTTNHIANMVASRRAYNEARTASFLSKKQEIVLDYQKSGLTRKEYSLQHCINYNTLKRYLKQD